MKRLQRFETFTPKLSSERERKRNELLEASKKKYNKIYDYVKAVEKSKDYEVVSLDWKVDGVDFHFRSKFPIGPSSALSDYHLGERYRYKLSLGQEGLDLEVENNGFVYEGSIGTPQDLFKYHLEKREDQFYDVEHIGSGTEGEVYSDSKYAYKVMRASSAPEDFSPYIGKGFKNVVNIIDVYSDEEEGNVVIKMELLEEINPYDMPNGKDIDEDEYDEVRKELWRLEDKVHELDNVIKHIKDSEIKKMVLAIKNAAKELKTGALDIGFHNLMYDPKTKEYKQIDIF